MNLEPRRTHRADVAQPQAMGRSPGRKGSKMLGVSDTVAQAGINRSGGVEERAIYPGIMGSNGPCESQRHVGRRAGGEWAGEGRASTAWQGLRERTRTLGGQARHQDWVP